MPNYDQTISSITTNPHLTGDISSRQPDTTLVQVLPTSGPVRSDRRTNGKHPARQTRISPLNAASGFSRASARLTADPPGEWPIHPTHNGHSSTTNIRYRPDSASPHIHLTQSNGHRDAHQRHVATLVHFDPAGNSGSRPGVSRSNTVSQTHASRRPGRGEEPIDPDNSRKAFTPAERPRGGVRQDKGVLTNAPSASPQPGAVENGRGLVL